MPTRSCRPLAVLCAALVVTAAPAHAENWFERLMSGGAKQAESAPAPAAPAEPKPATPAPAAKRPAPKPTEAAAPAAKPVVTAATPATPAPGAAPAAPNAREAVEKANAYFNGLSTLTGDFTQMGGDGRRQTGKLYLSRPGKLRFEYDAPATTEVIADGNSVAVRDRKLATQDLYLIGQTPLKFLLSNQVNLARDAAVTGVANEGDGVRLTMEDRSTLGGTSKITLTFDRGMESLSQWRIVDPQGYLTTVTLSNLERGRRVDPKLFVINYERMDANPR